MMRDVGAKLPYFMDRRFSMVDIERAKAIEKMFAINMHIDPNLMLKGAITKAHIDIFFIMYRYKKEYFGVNFPAVIALTYKMWMTSLGLDAMESYRRLEVGVYKYVECLSDHTIVQAINLN